MEKIRIYDLAKKLNKENKQILSELIRLGVTGKTHSSTIDERTAERVEQVITAKESSQRGGPRRSGPGGAPGGPRPGGPGGQGGQGGPGGGRPGGPGGQGGPGGARPGGPGGQGGPRPGGQGGQGGGRPGGPGGPRPGGQGGPGGGRPGGPGGPRPGGSGGGRPGGPGGQGADRRGTYSQGDQGKRSGRAVPPRRPDGGASSAPSAPSAPSLSEIEQKPDRYSAKHREAKGKKTKQISNKQVKQQIARKGQSETKRPGRFIQRETLGARLSDQMSDDIQDNVIRKDLDMKPEGISRPGMQKAFEAIRKLDPKRGPGGIKGGPRKRGGVGGGKGRGPMQDRTPERPTPSATAPRKKDLVIQEGATVKDFAEIIGVKIPDVIKKFMELGLTPTINQPLDTEAAQLVADAFGIELTIEDIEDAASDIETFKDDESSLIERPPIVTIMGHVDHGKTSLLDAIRETKVMDSEAGGITQHIGAYKVSLKGREIVFLDTPGHEAFTALRARGAKVTDIVVLIVAADDGVKPQTIEAIHHAKAAGVPIMVAINKIDKPDANLERVRNELTEHEIVSEEWGGKNIFAEISAKKRIGIENLLELILLQADVLELKANPNRKANGVIIESRIDKGKGPIATLLLQGGTLKIGDVFISGINYGKVRALYDDMGKRIMSAGPSTPVEVIGFNDVPSAGDTFAAVSDERQARQVALARESKLRSAAVAKKGKLTLEELYLRIKEGAVKDLNIVIKGDVQGSVEAIRESLEGIKHEEVKVQVIHAAVGGINESDVMLAMASNAIIIGFNVRPESKAAQTAEREGVDIELYNIIYEAIDDVKKALEGMLDPTLKEKILGHAEVRETFQVSRLGTIAGCMVIDGLMNRNCDGVRVIRDNIVVYAGKLGSLKRFKEDVKEVQQGYECGIMVANFNDLKNGDVIENFIIEKVAGKL